MKFTRGDTTVAFEKLWFFQRKHAQRYISLPPSTPYNPRHDLNKLALKPLLKHLEERSIKEDLTIFKNLPQETKEDFIRSLLHADAQNYTTPSEFIDRNLYFFIRPTKDQLRSAIPSLKLHNIPAKANPSVLSSFAKEFAALSRIENWDKDQLKAWTNTLIEKRLWRIMEDVGSDEESLEGLFRKAWSKLVHGYIRWAIAAGKPGPEGAVSMGILGKEETVRRFERAGDVMMEKEKGGGDGIVGGDLPFVVAMMPVVGEGAGKVGSGAVLGAETASEETAGAETAGLIADICDFVN